MISNFASVQALETQDHFFCKSLNLDSVETNILKSETYWRCRLSLAKNKIKTGFSPTNSKHNFQINDLISKISLDLSELHGSKFIKEIRKMGDHHHNQCVRMGYNPDTLDQAMVDNYLLCRKRIIEDKELDPPYGNLDYLEYPNRSYNVGFVIDRRLQKEEEKVKAAAKAYPACGHYNLRKTNFHTCAKAQDASRLCYSQVNRKRLQKEAVEKMICQKQSYIEFPNAFLKKQNHKNRFIKEVKTNADVSNQNTFASIGLDQHHIQNFQAVQKEEETDNTKQEQFINSKNELYDKIELTKLRQRYIHACHQEANIVLDAYIDELKKECEELKKFEELDE